MSIESYGVITAVPCVVHSVFELQKMFLKEFCVLAESLKPTLCTSYTLLNGYGMNLTITPLITYPHHALSISESIQNESVIFFFFPSSGEHYVVSTITFFFFFSVPFNYYYVIKHTESDEDTGRHVPTIYTYVYGETHRRGMSSTRAVLRGVGG